MSVVLLCIVMPTLPHDDDPGDEETLSTPPDDNPTKLLRFVALRHQIASVVLIQPVRYINMTIYVRSPSTSLSLPLFILSKQRPINQSFCPHSYQHSATPHPSHHHHYPQQSPSPLHPHPYPHPKVIPSVHSLLVMELH